MSFSSMVLLMFGAYIKKYFLLISIPTDFHNIQFVHISRWLRGIRCWCTITVQSALLSLVIFNFTHLFWGKGDGQGSGVGSVALVKCECILISIYLMCLSQLRWNSILVFNLFAKDPMNIILRQNKFMSVSSIEYWGCDHTYYHV